MTNLVMVISVLLTISLTQNIQQTSDIHTFSSGSVTLEKIIHHGLSVLFYKLSSYPPKKKKNKCLVLHQMPVDKTGSNLQCG